MAIPPQILDRLSTSLRERIEKDVTGDPDFVDFLLGSHGLLQVADGYAPRTWPYWSSSRQRREKRRLQKKYGPRWKEIWEVLRAEARSYQPPNLKAGLFGVEPSGPDPPGPAFEWNFWLAVYEVMSYFTTLSGQPHWELVGKVFRRTGEIRFEWYKREKFVAKKFGMTNKMWSKWSAVKVELKVGKRTKRVRLRKRVPGFDNGERVRKARHYYKHFRPVILKVLNTGIPIWAFPHKAEAEKLARKLDLSTVLAFPLRQQNTKKRSSIKR